MGRKSTEQKDYSKSAGQTALYNLVQQLYPDVVMKQDLNLRKMAKQYGYSWAEMSKEYGQSLAPIIADIVVSKPFIILEYNGQQHYKYTSHWHGDANGYRDAQERDNQKIWFCQRIAVPLIIFAYNEEMNIDTVRQRILEATESIKLLPGYSRCSGCKMPYKTEVLKSGLCKSCIRDIANQEYKKQQQQMVNEKRHDVGKDLRGKAKSDLQLDVAAQEKQESRKQELAQLRKERYRAQKEEFKNSEKYQILLADKKRMAEEGSQKKHDADKELRRKPKSEPRGDIAAQEGQDVKKQELAQLRKKKYRAQKEEFRNSEKYQSLLADKKETIKESNKKYKESPEYRKMQDDLKKKKSEYAKRQKEEYKNNS